MNNATWFDGLPLPAIFILSVVFTLVAIIVGKGLSNLRQEKAGQTNEVPGSVVGATLALLAFVLAFTFSMAANRFDARKTLLIDEVNAISTSYLRAGVLAEPFKSESRRLLRHYVDLRVQQDGNADKLQNRVADSEQTQDKLWALVEQMAQQAPLSIEHRLYIQSLNEMIDIQTKRVVVGLQTRVPSTIWIGLYMVAALAMIAVGYQFGQSRRPPMTLSLVLAMAFSSVLTLIADLDRAAAGTVQVNQQPMLELQQKFNLRQ